MPIFTYRNLDAWIKSYEFALAIYRATIAFPAEEKYALTLQLRKAAISIPSNIAEGKGRKSEKEFHHFLLIALGSLMEVETQILISKSLEFVTANVADQLLAQASQVGRLINGLAKSLRRADSR